MKHCTPHSSLPSGYATLDHALPQAGWPAGVLTEILVPRVGHGELNLLGPLLGRLTKAGRTVALLVPPHVSYAPALIQHGVALECVRLVRTVRPLDEGLDQLEPALQAGEFGALIAILAPDQAAAQSERTVGRLHRAARLAGCPAFLFHTCSTPATTSASQLRLLADMSQAGQIRLQRIAPAAEAGQGAVTLEIGQHAPGRAAYQRRAGPTVPAAQAPHVPQTRRAGASASQGADAGSPSAQPAGQPRTGQHGPQTQPVPPSRSSWPFKQRGGASVARGGPSTGYSAVLALLGSLGWNA